MPALNLLRRRTGLPHRILIDEAHYYLHDADAAQLLDFERNGYTIVTYCASRLPQALLAATEVMIVTCESNPAEMEALRACCAKMCRDRCARWAHPRSLEGRSGRRAPDHRRGRRRAAALHDRAAPHASRPSSRKYVDVPVSAHRALSSPRMVNPRTGFVRSGSSYLSWRDTPPTLLAGYIVRGDFSRWIADVFGDRALSGELRDARRAISSRFTR